MATHDSLKDNDTRGEIQFFVAALLIVVALVVAFLISGLAGLIMVMAVMTVLVLAALMWIGIGG